MKRKHFKSAGLAAAAFAAAALMAYPLPAAAATDDQAAYDAAVAAGTPLALREFIIQYPDSPLTDLAFNKLNLLCVENPEYEGCDLDDLVIPAAGPTPATPPGPPNGGGTNEKVSGS